MQFRPHLLLVFCPLLVLLTTAVSTQAIENAPSSASVQSLSTINTPTNMSRNEVTSTSKCIKISNDTESQCRPGSDYGSLKKGGSGHGGGGRGAGARSGGGGVVGGGGHSGTVAQRPMKSPYLVGFCGVIAVCWWF